MIPTTLMQQAAGGSAFLPTPFTSVNGPATGPSWTASQQALFEGWTVNWPTSNPTIPNPDGGSPQQFNVVRAGYTTAAAATTYTDTLTCTSLVRQTYPNNASNWPTTVAVSDIIYSTDTVPSATNNSTIVKPVPILNWILPDREVVGNTINLEVTGDDRDARFGSPVACVKFIATDAHSHSVSQIVSTQTVSGRAGDQNPIVVYACALDITSLTDGDMITVNFEVYPWIGGSASVFKTATAGADRRGPSPRYYLKSASLFANPYRIYVDAAGNDATAVVSQTDALAAAAPALTIQGALTKIKAISADGVQVRLRAGTFAAVGVSSGAMTQGVASLYITRDPAVAQASAIVTFGSGGSFSPKITLGVTIPTNTSSLRYDDVTINRAGAFGNAGDATIKLEVVYNNIATFDGGAQTATFVNNSSNYFYGVAFTNMGAGCMNATSVGQQRMQRGCLFPTTMGALETFCMVGSTLATVGSGSFPITNGGAADYTIVMFNKFMGITQASGIFAFNAVSVVNIAIGCVLTQNVFEYVNTASAYLLGLANDSSTIGITNFIMHYNSYLGFFQYGRHNIFYDTFTNSTTARFSQLMSINGNIFSAIYTKSDGFHYLNEANPEGFSAGSPSTRMGNWQFEYGAAAKWNFSMYQSNSVLGGVEAQIYPGIGCKIGTSQTVRNDPLYTTFGGTTNTPFNSGTTPVAGVGGSNAALQGGSPAKGMVKSAMLAFDLAGTARPTTGDSAGAYV